MKIEIDEEAGIVVGYDTDGRERSRHPLGSAEGFALASRAWLRAGWDAKHVYSFTWMGRPIIQLPEDMIRLQEVVHSVRPDVIVEMGIAHGGSAVFFASLCHLMGKGRVVAADIEIRPHNRAALEDHPMKSLITLIEGDSTEPATIEAVKRAVGPEPGAVLVFLDSNHTRDHVLKELEAYAPLVTNGSFCIVCDGIMKEVAGAPRTKPEWAEDNPVSAVETFLAAHPEFELAPPAFAFNEGSVAAPVTYWPFSHLKRR